MYWYLILGIIIPAVIIFSVFGQAIIRCPSCRKRHFLPWKKGKPAKADYKDDVLSLEEWNYICPKCQASLTLSWTDFNSYVLTKK